ncbi:hypothetical protein FBZ83_114105 [Azospirillum brasilense]|uniref:Uncharacterized protein n=1 Tax=Azospirillum brasilense TaxID=192 RepID=A0A560BYT8_AZOBR|nr:hypothetical protein [Azospirillum brasilense]TWA77774.1 hypothetical protein FBZ83_114105 [Azospirillum brasilense]
MPQDHADHGSALAFLMTRAKAMDARSLYICGSPSCPRVGFRSGPSIVYEPLSAGLAGRLVDRFAVDGHGLSQGLLVWSGRHYRWFAMPMPEGDDGYAPLIAVHRPAICPGPGERTMPRVIAG